MEIEHDVRQRKFYSVIKGVEYSLEYNEAEPGVWEFHCPYLPEDKRESDILDKLAEYALYFMRRNGIQLLDAGSCKYVSGYLERKKDLQVLVKDTLI
jgi:hypothetical protein